MRFLKQLHVQGYKTFASRTEFLFDRGVTAVIGPNGSGKSNLADALRWVLGEQSYGTLRARRTEDMIFTGSEQRARLGMASVSLVLDNSTAWLPTPFSEVEITRRAYRSGDNEYYLNGTRVRLREIAELLGNSGLSERTYTVIGQGMVDQALSQRPEERRRLFEEAAGITVHQAKRDQALRQMEDARTNLTRAADIVAEITPRMRYLKGQARRAQEYQQVKADLDAQLRVWYAYRWRSTREALTSAGERMSHAQGASESELARMNEMIAGMAAARSERSSLREQLGEWHRESSGLHRLAEAAQRELAVRGEQARLFGQQAAELRGELGSLQAAMDDGAERLAEAQARLQEAEEGHAEASARVAAARAALQERERERSGVNAQAAEAERAALSLKSQLADRQARLTHAEERRANLQQQRERQEQEAATAAGQVARLAAALRGAEERMAAITAEAGQIEQERRAQATVLAAAQGRERAAREQLGAAQRVLHRLQDQREMLERLRDEGAGLAAGPRNVMAAREKLRGIMGTLGDLIETPAELERAIEAALGGRLQDIVVGSWSDAEAAVAFLKREQGGRATFLPLDSLRPSQAVQPPRMPGVLGLASELVRFPAAIRPAVEHALNRTIVVQDLPAARKVLGRDGYGTLVTLEGDIVRPGGSVTGGSENSRRDGGVLSRARTLRELPGQIEAAGAEVRRWEGEVKAAREEQAAVESELARLNARGREVAQGRDRSAAERDRTRVQHESAQRSGAWQQEQLQRQQQEIETLAGQITELQGGVAAIVSKLDSADRDARTARSRAAGYSTDEQISALAREQAQADVSQRNVSAQLMRVRDLQAQLESRRRDSQQKSARAAQLDQQQREAETVAAAQREKAGELGASIAALAALIDPSEARVAELERGQRAAEAQEQEARERVRLAGLRLSQTELAQQRAEDNLQHLRREIEKDLGLVLLEGEDEGDDQPPLPLNGVVTRLPEVEELPENLERDVRELRAQIGRLGPVNLEAPAEYAELEARHTFLTTQAADLEQAVARLLDVIAELDRVMERDFVVTFKAVAAEFREQFKKLFGGGSARLVLSDPENPGLSGIEIYARPPGKREQGLPLLSGGERALTAAALIFSILKVRPTPFCVLDEVDAALDEANVGRFRDALRELSELTQFILITHNRGTIEAADTIYGISMGTDNTSQVLSLKLDGHVVEQPETEQVIG